METTDELDYLIQIDQMEIVNVEAKSARNVRAKTLNSFLDKTRAPYACILIVNDFARFTTGDGRELRHLPLYTAGFIEERCIIARLQAMRPRLEKRSSAPRILFICHGN